MLKLKCVVILGVLLTLVHGTPGQMSPSIAGSRLLDTVRSALNAAIAKQRRQNAVNAFSVRRGFDESRSFRPRAFISARSQHSDINNYLENTSVVQNQIAFLVTETTVNLGRTLGFSAPSLQRDPGITRAWRELAPPDCIPRIPFCPPSTLIYRTIDGSCNNRHNPTWGMASRPQNRYLPPAYDDGISSPRTRGQGGYPLPGARQVSNVIHSAMVGDLKDNDDTIMVMQFGQLLDHDLSDTPTLKGDGGSTPECCNIPPDIGSERELCFPIPIPFYDPRFRKRCMHFVRSAIGVNDHCTLGERNQLNQLSSYIDASFLYGSDLGNEFRIRDNWGGRLVMTHLGFYGEHERPNNCIKESPGDYCMKSGDRKIHVTPILTSISVMFLRQHNMIAHALSKINPHWDHEQLYQMTRKIIAAITQHITYTEYLPSILDPWTMEMYGLTGPPQGYDTRYDVTVDATINNAFAAAAFRFGHSQIPNFIKMINLHRQYFEVNLTATFNKPTLVFRDNGDGYHGLNRWLSVGMGSRPDQFIEDSVRNNLFLDANGDAFDLAALNIQRGRDHGLPGYNAWRQWLHLPPALRFVTGPGGFTDIGPKTVHRLSNLYRHPDDVDLFTAGLSEDPRPGGAVGPTFAGILATQYKHLKMGDRFWYENNFPESGFTLAQLNSIKHFTLARMACNTVDIKFIQRNVFKIPVNSNREVPCEMIPDIDLTLWRDIGAKHG